MKPQKPTEYKHGDIHTPSGRIFLGYVYNNNKWYELKYKSKNVFGAQLEIMESNAKQRAIKDQLPFDIDFDYLKSIATQTCPVFGIQLAWGTLGEGLNGNSPSLDKIKPEWGYVRGNVVIISQLANTIKQDVGWEEIMRLAVWLKEKIKEVEQNVKPEQLTSIPTRTYKQGKADTELRTIPAPGTWEDNYDADHHRGAVYGQDTDNRTQAGSGNSLAHRNKKMEPSHQFTLFEDNGEPEPETSGIELRGGRLFD